MRRGGRKAAFSFPSFAMVRADAQRARDCLGLISPILTKVRSFSDEQGREVAKLARVGLTERPVKVAPEVTASGLTQTRAAARIR
jgi:hypothetical protein